MIEKLCCTLELIKMRAPLVHCITNGVTSNDCANAVLDMGASPIMAEDPSESHEITAVCHALVLNMGTPSQTRFLAMMQSAKVANKRGIPIILDPVGVGATKFRAQFARDLLKQVKVQIIRGNYSEICALQNSLVGQKGVDTAPNATLAQKIHAGKTLAAAHGCVVVLSGQQDVITDGTTTYVLDTGHSLMGQITGCGCMLSALLGAFAGANDDYLTAAVAGVCTMGVCGKLACEKAVNANLGTGSARVFLHDYLSTISPHQLEEECHIELCN